MEIERDTSGHGWVVLDLVWRAEGRASGAPLEMRVVAAYRLEEDLIAEARHYWRFEEALADLGLDG